MGLQRRFAIEVDDYDEKEVLLDDIFSKNRIANTELFALDIDLVVQLLSSFDGKQIYPESKTKEETFDDAMKERMVKANWNSIPNGLYYLSETKKGFGKITATMRVDEGMFIVLKGSICAPAKEGWLPESRKNAPIKDILQEDTVCNSPSTAGWIALGHSVNGWLVWKDSAGQPIDCYRKSGK